MPTDSVVSSVQSNRKVPSWVTPEHCDLNWSSVFGTPERLQIATPRRCKLHDNLPMGQNRSTEQSLLLEGCSPLQPSYESPKGLQNTNAVQLSRSDKVQSHCIDGARGLAPSRVRSAMEFWLQRRCPTASHLNSVF